MSAEPFRALSLGAGVQSSADHFATCPAAAEFRKVPGRPAMP